MVILAGVTAALVADQKPPAQFQHAIDLPEALRQIRPEVDRFKGCDRIEPAVRKDDLLHTALPHHCSEAVLMPAGYGCGGRKLRGFHERLPTSRPAFRFHKVDSFGQIIAGFDPKVNKAD